MDKTKKITAKGILKALTGEYSFILSFIVLCILGRVFNEKFFTWNNLTNLFVQGSMIGLIAMGMTMVISAGMIDISVGSQVALIGGFGILVLNATGSAWVMLLFCICAGCILGLINGVLVILIPTVVIGVCGSADMPCHSGTKPALIIAGALIIVTALINAVSYIVSKKKA